jgi:hypothetical protein
MLYTECHNAECHYSKCHNAECHYSECHNAECHYSECHYTYTSENKLDCFTLAKNKDSIICVSMVRTGTTHSVTTFGIMRLSTMGLFSRLSMFAMSKHLD